MRPFAKTGLLTEARNRLKSVYGSWFCDFALLVPRHYNIGGQYPPITELPAVARFHPS